MAIMESWIKYECRKYSISAVNGLFGDLDSAPSVESTLTFTECTFTGYTSDQYNYVANFDTGGADLTVNFDSCEWTSLSVKYEFSINGYI